MLTVFNLAIDGTVLARTVYDNEPDFIPKENEVHIRGSSERVQGELLKRIVGKKNGEKFLTVEFIVL